MHGILKVPYMGTLTTNYVTIYIYINLNFNLEVLTFPATVPDLTDLKLIKWRSLVKFHALKFVFKIVILINY